MVNEQQAATSVPKEVQYDVDGYDAVTSAVRELINQYPGLSENDEIAFSMLDENSGKAMFPVSGGIIDNEKEDITGHVTQTCLYPFVVIYRVEGLSENRKEVVKEWLDSLGKWLEKQPVTINGTGHKLSEYPALTGERKFLKIFRTSPGYLDSINENKSENWAISLAAKYQNEFDR